MIRVSLSSLAVVLVAAMLGPVLILWIWSEWRRSRAERQALRNRRQCRLCGFEFAPPTPAEICPCPRCAAATDGRQPERL